MSADDKYSRIKSFVRRNGRLSYNQKFALANYWAKYGLKVAGAEFNFSDIFGPNIPVILEIGFGNGDALIESAKSKPDTGFIGIEVYRPGIAAVMIQADEQGLNNIRLFNADAVVVLSNCIPDCSLNGVKIFFPDPWHKIRHKKRRLIQSDFIKLLAKKMSIGGSLRLATDWEDYALQMLRIINESKLFINQSSSQGFLSQILDRPKTKFESRGEKLGHRVWDLGFTKR